MRRILVERARHYQRLRHGGGASQVELETAWHGPIRSWSTRGH